MWGNAFADDDTLEREARRRVRHRDGHVAPRADDARAAGVEALRQGRRGTTSTTTRRCARSGAGIERCATMGAAREHRHDRHARRRRHADDDERREQHRAARDASSPTSARSSPTVTKKDRVADAAALGALQGSAGLLRQGHARPRRRHAALLRRQLGQHPPPAERAPNAIAPAASASTTTSTTSAARATTSGSTRIRSRASGSRCTSRTSTAREPHLDRERRRPQADGVPDLSSSSTTRGIRTRIPAERPAGVHAAVGGAAVRRGARGGDRRHHDDVLKYAGRRKPELLDTATYSLTNYREAERVVDDVRRAARSRARELSEALPPQYARRVLRAGAAPDRGRGEPERAVRHGREESHVRARRGARRRTISPTARATLFEQRRRDLAATTTRSSPAASGAT